MCASRLGLACCCCCSLKSVPWGLPEGAGFVWGLLGGVAEGQQLYDGEQRAGHAQQTGHAEKADKSSLLPAEGRLPQTAVSGATEVFVTIQGLPLSCCARLAKLGVARSSFQQDRGICGHVSVKQHQADKHSQPSRPCRVVVWQQGLQRVTHLKHISLARPKGGGLIRPLLQAVHARPCTWGHPLSPKQLQKHMCTCASCLRLTRSRGLTLYKRARAAALDDDNRSTPFPRQE